MHSKKTKTADETVQVEQTIITVASSHSLSLYIDNII